MASGRNIGIQRPPTDQPAIIHLRRLIRFGQPLHRVHRRKPFLPPRGHLCRATNANE